MSVYILYNAILWLALPLIVGYHFYRSVSRGRPASLGERFGFVAPDLATRLQGREVIWVHAVSVGETIAVRPLLRGLRERYPERAIVVSNVTETGRGVAATLPEVELCLYFPLDYSFAARRLLGLVRPSLIIMMETEIWPNFLREAAVMGIPVAMANGRISDRSFGRYLRLSWFFRPVLANFAALCMQSAEDRRRIAAIGAPAERIHVTGNLKFDIRPRALSPEQRGEQRRQYALGSRLRVVTAGSTHPGEEEQVVAAYREVLAREADAFLVLVPRHPERAGEVGALLAREGIGFTLRSRLAERNEELSAGEVLLVDTVGELLSFYAVSDLVFVGGSLVPTGGHNVLEPAACGVPVVFGPHMNNFREIAAIVLAAGAGVQVAGGSELAELLTALLGDPERSRRLGEAGLQLIATNSGATERHLDVIAPFLVARTCV